MYNLEDAVSIFYTLVGNQGLKINFQKLLKKKNFSFLSQAMDAEAPFFFVAVKGTQRCTVQA